jgi:hypothetical protein
MKRLDNIIYKILLEEDSMDDALKIANDAVEKTKSESSSDTSSDAESKSTEETNTTEEPEKTEEVPDETEELINKLFASPNFSKNLTKVLADDTGFLRKIFKKIKIGVQK